MARDLKQITHLTFDVGSTVFDWHHGIIDEMTALASAEGGAVARRGWAEAGAAHTGSARASGGRKGSGAFFASDGRWSFDGHAGPVIRLSRGAYRG